MQGWDSAWRDQFSSGQKKILPVGWVLDANTAAETWEQSGTLPHALLDPQALEKKATILEKTVGKFLCHAFLLWFGWHQSITASLSMPEPG